MAAMNTSMAVKVHDHARCAASSESASYSLFWSPGLRIGDARLHDCRSGPDIRPAMFAELAIAPVRRLLCVEDSMKARADSLHGSGAAQ
jgi:hypothetical protein